jgi:membrane-associated protein
VFDPETIIQAGGLAAIALIIFAECGLLIGLFFPGDSLLLTAGFFAAQGKLPLSWLIAIIVISSIIGYEVGYEIGDRLGPRMFKRSEGVLFRKEYIEKTDRFFDRYGKITVLFARFIPHVRTFVSLIAGAGRMDRGVYIVYNILGGILWGAGLTLLGYWVGTSVPNVDKFFVPLIIAVIVIFYSLVIWGLLKSPHRRNNLWHGLKSDMRYIFRRNTREF